VFLVGVTGLEPAASWSQTTRAPICATPRDNMYYYIAFEIKKQEKNICNMKVFYVANIKSILDTMVKMKSTISM
jgi:hypothetical protein